VIVTIKASNTITFFISYFSVITYTNHINKVMIVITKATLPRISWKQLTKVLCPIRAPREANKPAIMIELTTAKTTGTTIINSDFPR
jgi:hypothetical protein